MSRRSVEASTPEIISIAVKRAVEPSRLPGPGALTTTAPGAPAPAPRIPSPATSPTAPGHPWRSPLPRGTGKLERVARRLAGLAAEIVDLALQLDHAELPVRGGPVEPGQLLVARQQLVLRAPAFGDVVHHADRADDPARGVADVLAFFADVADFPRGFPHDSMVDLVEIRGAPYRLGIRGVHGGPVVRVDTIQEHFVGGRGGQRGQPEYPVDLVGPGQAVGGQVELPAAHVGDFLRLVHPRLALAQGLLRAAALRDVQERHHDARQGVLVPV